MSYYLAEYSCIQNHQFNDNIYGYILCDIGSFARKIDEEDISHIYYKMAGKAIHIGETIYVNEIIYLANYYGTININYERAKKYLLILVEKGNSSAMFSLGYHYQYCEINYEEMKKYYNVAIENRHHEALYYLGLYYEEIEEDYDKARNLYQLCIIRLYPYDYFDRPEIVDKSIKRENDLKDGTRLQYHQLKKYTKNLEELKKIFKIYDKNTSENECLICRTNQDHMLNLKCKKMHDHCYCTECFHKWYKTNAKKCIACVCNFEFNEIVFLS